MSELPVFGVERDQRDRRRETRRPTQAPAGLDRRGDAVAPVEDLTPTSGAASSTERNITTTSSGLTGPADALSLSSPTTRSRFTRRASTPFAERPPTAAMKSIPATSEIGVVSRRAHEDLPLDVVDRRPCGLLSPLEATNLSLRMSFDELRERGARLREEIRPGRFGFVRERDQDFCGACRELLEDLVLRPGEVGEAIDDDELRLLKRFGLARLQQMASIPEAAFEIVELRAIQRFLVVAIKGEQLLVASREFSLRRTSARRLLTRLGEVLGPDSNTFSSLMKLEARSTRPGVSAEIEAKCLSLPRGGFGEQSLDDEPFHALVDRTDFFVA